MSQFVELHTASAFSFLRGASTPETLVERAAALGYSAIALVDRDGLYGAPRFHKAATAAGLKPIIGAELTIATTNPQPATRNPQSAFALQASARLASPARNHQFVLPV